MPVLEMREQHIMGRPKTKVTIHFKDWRVIAVIAYMAGIVSVTAPQMLVLILIVGAIIGIIKLVELGRL